MFFFIFIFFCLYQDQPVAAEWVCDYAPTTIASPEKTQKIVENIPRQLCGTSCEPNPISKLRRKLTEVDKLGSLIGLSRLHLFLFNKLGLLPLRLRRKKESFAVSWQIESLPGRQFAADR